MRVICAIGDPDAITADTEPRPQSMRTRGPMAPAIRLPERCSTTPTPPERPVSRPRSDRQPAERRGASTASPTDRTRTTGAATMPRLPRPDPRRVRRRESSPPRVHDGVPRTRRRCFISPTLFIYIYLSYTLEETIRFDVARESGRIMRSFEACSSATFDAGQWVDWVSSSLEDVTPPSAASTSRFTIRTVASNVWRSSPKQCSRGGGGHPPARGLPKRRGGNYRKQDLGFRPIQSADAGGVAVMAARCRAR